MAISERLLQTLTTSEYHELVELVARTMFAVCVWEKKLRARHPDTIIGEWDELPKTVAEAWRASAKAALAGEPLPDMGAKS